VLIELVNDESKLVTSVADDTLLTLVDVHELHLVRQDSKGQEQWLTNERGSRSELSGLRSLKWDIVLLKVDL
jgi:hypothetical protein